MRAVSRVALLLAVLAAGLAHPAASGRPSSVGTSSSNSDGSQGQAKEALAQITPAPTGTRCAGGPICPGECPPGQQAVNFRTCLPESYIRMNLAAGCNNVTLAFPDHTLVGVVAARVFERSINLEFTRVEAVWKFDASAQRFLGWVGIVDAPVDFQEVNRLDVVYLCITKPGFLMQPPL